ncbi:MAG: UDP-N-acetylmuramoyl-tripeptide--D-alanyl-D-alanine ligase [Patescibacteria group bacterium]
MKKYFINALQFVLKTLAHATIWRYRPGIVGVTGSVGKTSTKLAIATVLANERSVRVSPGNFNNELGLPLAVLGDWQEIRGLLFWPRVIVAALWRLIVKATDYPEILVLEYGVDRPGDMRRLIAIARPNLSLVTAVGEIPAHVEFFTKPEAVAREKARLIECLPVASFAVLNRDSDMVMDLKDRTRAHLITFGFSRDADVAISGYENRTENGRPAGIGLKLNYGGASVPVRLDGVFGRAQAYAAAGAACVGIVFGMNLLKIAEALKGYRPPRGRMELFLGLKPQTIVLDDSYNANPLSVEAALDTLKDLPAKRRITVLGDMREIGKYAMAAHEDVGRTAAKVVDLLVTVGPLAKFIAEGAKKGGLKKGEIFSFETAEEAHGHVQDLIRAGDVVLVKGSRAVALEKVVQEIIAKPEMPPEAR